MTPIVIVVTGLKRSLFSNNLVFLTSTCLSVLENASLKVI